MREPGDYEALETIHVYVLRESDQLPPIIDAEPEQESEAKHSPQLLQEPNIFWGRMYVWSIGVLFTLIPIVAILAANLLPAYDTILSKTLTFTLSLHPAPNQIQLYHLPDITETRQITAPATGSSQEPAMKAVGLLTFYNGQLTSVVIPAGTTLKGKDGISVVTAQIATIPPATPTTPPTEGTVSVTAYSAIAGTSGNIAAQDINQACCGTAILVQNLNAFSGGKDAQTVTVVTSHDILNATTSAKTDLDQKGNDQAQQELSPGQQLVPLVCTTSMQTNQQAGDQAQTIQVTTTEHCTPFAYTATSVEHQASLVLPHGYKALSTSIILLAARVPDLSQGTGSLTIHLTAYLQLIRSAPIRYR